MKRGRDSERICHASKVIILGTSNLIFSALSRFGKLHDHVLLEQADIFLGVYPLKSTGGKTEKCFKTWRKHKIVPLLSNSLKAFINILIICIL